MRATGDLERPVFSLVVLVDPPKDVVVAFESGDEIARRARVVVTDRATRRTHEGIVDLGTGGLESWRVLDGVLPPIVDEDFERAAEAALADPRFVEALRRRGIEDLSIVQVDPLSAGSFPQNPAGPPDRLGRRRTSSRTRSANAYSSPIEHLRASVDLDTGEVVDVLDHDPIVPISTADGDYETEEAVGGWRDDIAPAGHRPARRARLRARRPRAALAGLAPARRAAPGRRPRAVRPALPRRRGGPPILYRAALGEMVVPYGDPHDGFYWRTYFDAGEYGIGRMANSLQLGCDCLGEIRYIDAVARRRRRARRATIPNAICIHEEDAGILWKHTDRVTGMAHVRRSRKLVVSFFATVGNYDYGFYWSLLPGRHDRAGGEADRHRRSRAA